MKAPRNKTIDLSVKDGKEYLDRCLTLKDAVRKDQIKDRTAGQGPLVLVTRGRFLESDGRLGEFAGSRSHWFVGPYCVVRVEPDNTDNDTDNIETNDNKGNDEWIERTGHSDMEDALEAMLPKEREIVKKFFYEDKRMLDISIEMNMDMDLVGGYIKSARDQIAIWM